jgi:hypothetical protein
MEKTQFVPQLRNSPSRTLGKGLDLKPGQMLDQFERVFLANHGISKEFHQKLVLPDFSLLQFPSAASVIRIPTCEDCRRNEQRV